MAAQSEQTQTLCLLFELVHGQAQLQKMTSCAGATIIDVYSAGFLKTVVYARTIYVWMCVCVYNAAFDSHWGGGGDAACVFALAAFQHSTFLCDIQNCDLKKPTLQKGSLFFLHSSSICKLFFVLLPPPKFSLLLSCPPFKCFISKLSPAALNIYSRFPKGFPDRGEFVKLPVWPSWRLPTLLWSVHLSMTWMPLFN